MTPVELAIARDALRAAGLSDEQVASSGLGRVEMPHAGHFIGGGSCWFRRATYVNGYIISTVGEYKPAGFFEREGGEAGGSSFLRMRRDDDPAQEIGFGRYYETMVFKAVRSTANHCCPYAMADALELEMVGYNDASAAAAGHEAMVRKWEFAP